MHPCSSESYREYGSCFSHQTGQDLVFAHLVHYVGIIRHHDGHLLHHVAQNMQPRELLTLTQTNHRLCRSSFQFQISEMEKIHLECWTHSQYLLSESEM